MCVLKLPVTNVDRTRQFLEAVGAVAGENLPGESGPCLTFDHRFFIGLLSHEEFLACSGRESDRRDAVSNFVICLAEATRDAVEKVVRVAEASGGKADPVPAEEAEFMLARSFADPDGNVFNVTWFDPRYA